MDAGRPLRERGEGRRPVRVSVEHGQVEAGQDMAEDREVASSLDAGTENRDARLAREHIRRKSGDCHAADRRGLLGGDRAGVDDRDGEAGGRVGQQDEPVNRGDVVRAVGREAGDPLDAEQVVRPFRLGAPKMGRHRVGERTIGPRMDADLRRQLGVVDERGQSPLGEAEPLRQRRHRGADIGRGQVAERGRVRGRHRRESSAG